MPMDGVKHSGDKKLSFIVSANCCHKIFVFAHFGYSQKSTA